MAITIPIISEFDGTGINKAIAQFKQLETNGQKAQFAIKKAAVPAGLAIAGLAVALGDAAKGAMEDENAQAILATTLKKTTGATDAQIKANESWISTQGKLLGVTDDELRPALGRLAKATGSMQKAQELASAAMDIAASTGKPLATVTASLEKAYGGNMTALAKLSPELRQMIKDGASFDEVMAAMAKTTGGAATTAANTAQGQFKRLGVALSETKESIGAALLPAIEAVLPFLQQMGQWAQDHTTTFVIIAGVIGGIAAAVVVANAAMTAWGVATKVFTGIQMAFNAVMAMNPITLMVLAVAALVAGIILAYKHFDAFRNIVDTVGRAIKTGFLVYFEVIKTEAQILYNVFKAVFNGIATLWNNSVGALSFKAPSWVPGIGGKGFDVPNIPMLAAGGIVTSPTLAMIGERGPEAVIPLSGPNAGGGMGGMTIVVQAGLVSTPDQIGMDIIQAIQKAQRRSGQVFANAVGVAA